MSEALRRGLDYVNDTQQRRTVNLEELGAASMNPVSRAWTSGRINLDANAALADEASARAAGDTARADEAAGRAQAARDRAGIYAPRVGSLEDIGGVTDALSWAGSQMGQGAASMLDPAAVAAAGTALGRVPGLGRLAPIAGAIGAFGYNQRQMTGEHYGRLKDDPVALSNLTPQQANTQANLVGLGSGALETVLPGIAGRALGGGALRQGARAVQPGTGVRTLGGMGLEGLTELGQEGLNQAVLSHTNPNRDRSGDTSDLVNAFAGGAVGGAPFAAAGAMADGAYGRAARRRSSDPAAQPVQEQSGQVVDLAAGPQEPQAKAAQKFRNVVDLGMEDGKESATVPQAAQFSLTPDEANVLQATAGADLDAAGVNAWAAENAAQRMEVVSSRLGQMAEEGNPTAEEFLNRLSSDDPMERMTALDEASEHLINQHEMARATKRAAEFTKNRGSKKNLQGAGFSTLSYDDWVAERQKNRSPEGERRTHAIQKAVEGRTALQELRKQPVDPEAAKASKERARAFGELLAAEARSRPERRLLDFEATVDFDNYARSLAYELEDLATSWAYRIDGEGLDATATSRQGVRPSGQEARQFGAMTEFLDALAGDIRGLLGPEAGETIGRMAGLTDDPLTQPFFEYLRERADGWRGTREERDATRTALADQMVALLPQEQQAAVREGRGERDLFQAVEMVSRGRVTPTKRKEIEQAVGGTENLNRMLEMYGGTLTDTGIREEATDMGRLDDSALGDAPMDSDESGEATQTSAWEQRMKEKTAERGAGERRYGVSRSPSMRTNPFDPLKRVTKEQRQAFMNEEAQRRREGLPQRLFPDYDRPRLFTQGQKNSDGSDAIGKRTEDMARRLGPDFDVTSRSALSVMEDMAMPPSQRLAIYRDYMREIARDESLTPEQRATARKHADASQLALRDAMENPEAWGGRRNANVEMTEEQLRGSGLAPRRGEARRQGQLTAAQRKAVSDAMNRYFGSRFLAVAERKIDRESSRIDAVELRRMIENGRRAHDSARQQENLAESNLIFFRSPLADERTGKAADVPIRANALVAWVRSQRALSEEFQAAEGGTNRSKNDQFLDDLSEGISILMSSGFVGEGNRDADGNLDVMGEPDPNAPLPYMLDDKGRKHTFDRDFPPVLQLENTSYAGYQFGRRAAAERAAERGSSITDPESEDYQLEVAFDQLRGEGPQDAPVLEGSGDPYSDIIIRARGNNQARTQTMRDISGRTPQSQQDIDTSRADAARERERQDSERDDTAGGSTAQAARRDDGIGPEPKSSAMRMAPERADAMLETFRRDGAKAGIEAVERRLRTAQTNNANQRQGPVGGEHYAYPLAYVLDPETIATMDVVGDDAQRIVLARSQLADILSKSKLKPADRVTLARAMAPAASRDRITAVNAGRILERGAEAYRQSLQAEGQPTPAAREVAAPTAPKSPSRPVGAVAKAVAFRQEREQLLKDHESRVDTLARRAAGQRDIDPNELARLRYMREDLAATAYDLRAEGKSMQEAIDNPKFQEGLSVLIAHRMRGNEVAADMIRSLLHTIEMTFAMDADNRVDPAVRAAIAKPGAKLRDALTPVAKDSQQGAAPIIAQAVMKVAGDVPISFIPDSEMEGAGGRFRTLTGEITINERGGETAVVLHEGAHAATVAGIASDEKLHRALFDLTDHILNVAPELANAYGLTNTLEFLAEGFSNRNFQQRLKKIPPSSAVRKYLGENVANAWDAFVSLVRRALDLPQEHESALSQMLELGARAMVATKKTGVTADMGRFPGMPVIPVSDYEQRTERLLKELEKAGMNEADVGQLSVWLAPAGVGDMPYHAALGNEIARRSIPRLKREGDLNIGSVMEVVTSTRNLGAQSLPSIRNAQNANRPPASDADIKAAREYVEKVLGKQIKAEFKEITDYSGEWIDAENTIRVSTITNAGVLNVARHEALHAFFSKFVKNSPRALRAFKSLTDDPRIVRRLEALLKDDPAALRQLADGEERLAYIYQFAMAGVLRLPHTPGTTLMGKVRKFLRRVFQMVSEQERAVDLLYAFEAGRMSEPSSAAKVVADTLDQGTWMRAGTRHLDPFKQRMAALVLPANEILATSSSKTAREIGRMFFTNPGEEGALGRNGQPGYLNQRNEMMRRYDNAFRATIDSLDDRQQRELIVAMQNETPVDRVSDPDVAESMGKLRSIFDRFHRYMTDEKGLSIGKINENYFPVVWDAQKLQDNPQAFKDMLTSKYAKELASMAESWERKRQRLVKAGKPTVTDPITTAFVVDELASKLTWDMGVDKEGMAFKPRQDGVIRPWMASGEARELNFIKPEDRAPFLEKDLVTTLSRYVRQGVRTAEYSSRFGRTGEKLNSMLAQIRDELEETSGRMLSEGEIKSEKAREDWVRRQYRDVANAVGAMEGTLGADINPTLRKLNSWGVVYQNVRLLPLALFASFVDPLGIVARGGEMREAFTTFTNGLKGVVRQWGDMLREEPAARVKEQWEKLAEDAGVIDAAIFSHLLADEYGSVFMDSKAKKINEVMFKANGMDAWNRAMRVGATKAAVKFIERHHKNPGEHSRRWLDDLGLGALNFNQVLDAEGNLITSKPDLMDRNPDMELTEAEAIIGTIHHAVNRWVEGAIVSPNAAQRPAWGSDPHFGMVWHLKQFAYSFHQTILKRAMSEAKHGNVMPLGVFAWYIPAMIASDVTRGMLVGGGELPGYMQSYDLGDWMVHGVERSGVLGMGQVGIDALDNPLSVGGPMFEQIADIFTDPVERNVVRALPVNALYRSAIE